MRQTLLLRRHFVRDPTHGPSAANGFPPRSHNSLLHNCPSTSATDGRVTFRRQIRSAAALPAIRSTFRQRLIAVPGGGERDRTDDLLLAKQALSQLSYTPVPEVRDRGSVIRTANLRRSDQARRPMPSVLIPDPWAPDP